MSSTTDSPRPRRVDGRTRRFQAANEAKQRTMLAFIADYSREHGYAPNLAEIGASAGLTSLATVSRHVNRLRDNGYLTVQPLIPRSIVLTGKLFPAPGSRQVAAPLDQGNVAA